jgi:quinol monooxygenase YgiN
MEEAMTSEPKGKSIVGRIWFGRTRADRADEYLDYNAREGVASIAAKPGCLGVQQFCRIKGDIAEFTVISYWPSIEAMKAMHKDDGDPMRVSHLDRDAEFLLELPEYVEVTELFINHWNDEAAKILPPHAV